MTTPGKKQWLSAAECAARTGLTVRALRVYEREGLIKPARSEKGWRRYGPAEVARLNAIMSFKALGLTLVQIQQVMAANPPPLMRILELQAKSWNARRATAERALTLLETAMSRLRSSQNLSVEELCDLVKGLDLSRSTDMQSTHAIFRASLNDSLSAEEERLINTWWANHPADLAQVTAYGKSLKVVHSAIERLAQQDEDPSSPEAQELIERHRKLGLQHGVVERALRQMEWNPVVAARFYGVGLKLEARRPEVMQPEQFGPTLLSQKGKKFFKAVTAASARVQSLRKLIGDVKKLVKAHVDPESPEAQHVIERFCEICRVHDFGDPYLYIQWIRFSLRIARKTGAAGAIEAVWAFLARALVLREGRDIAALSEWEDRLQAISEARVSHN